MSKCASCIYFKYENTDGLGYCICLEVETSKYKHDNLRYGVDSENCKEYITRDEINNPKEGKNE